VVAWKGVHTGYAALKSIELLCQQLDVHVRALHLHQAHGQALRLKVFQPHSRPERLQLQQRQRQRLGRLLLAVAPALAACRVPIIPHPSERFVTQRQGALSTVLPQTDREGCC